MALRVDTISEHDFDEIATLDDLAMADNVSIHQRSFWLDLQTDQRIS
jgi:hypothetical protein